MPSTKSRIASELERSFARRGFAEQGVAALRATAAVRCAHSIDISRRAKP